METSNNGDDKIQVSEALLNKSGKTDILNNGGYYIKDKY